MANKTNLTCGLRGWCGCFWNCENFLFHFSRKCCENGRSKTLSPVLHSTSLSFIYRLANQKHKLYLSKATKRTMLFFTFLLSSFSAMLVDHVEPNWLSAWSFQNYKILVLMKCFLGVSTTIEKNYETVKLFGCASFFLFCKLGNNRVANKLKWNFGECSQFNCTRSQQAETVSNTFLAFL